MPGLIARLRALIHVKPWSRSCPVGSYFNYFPAGVEAASDSLRMMV